MIASLGRDKKQAIIVAARGWLGTPFRHQGRTRGVGVDCVGLIIGVARELGIVAKNFDHNRYGKQPDPDSMLRVLRDHLDRVPVRLAEPGDILYMRFREDPQHLAILTDASTIIHAYAQGRRCLEHAYTDQWRDRTVATFRYRWGA